MTGENYIACVSPESAVKLAERGWGITHKADPHKGVRGAECTNSWVIHYSDEVIPSKSRLIKTIRETTNEFANEQVVWGPVKIVDHIHNIITISSHGSFHDVYLNQILDNLSNVEYVLNVEHKPRACL